jgi:hypothetical protein
MEDFGRGGKEFPLTKDRDLLVLKNVYLNFAGDNA